MQQRKGNEHVATAGYRTGGVDAAKTTGFRRPGASGLPAAVPGGGGKPDKFNRAFRHQTGLLAVSIPNPLRGRLMQGRGAPFCGVDGSPPKKICFPQHSGLLQGAQTASPWLARRSTGRNRAARRAGCGAKRPVARPAGQGGGRNLRLHARHPKKPGLLPTANIAKSGLWLSRDTSGGLVLPGFGRFADPGKRPLEAQRTDLVPAALESVENGRCAIGRPGFL